MIEDIYRKYLSKLVQIIGWYIIKQAQLKPIPSFTSAHIWDTHTFFFFFYLFIIMSFPTQVGLINLFHPSVLVLGEFTSGGNTSYVVKVDS